MIEMEHVFKHWDSRMDECQCETERLNEQYIFDIEYCTSLTKDFGTNLIATARIAKQKLIGVVETQLWPTRRGRPFFLREEFLGVCHQLFLCRHVTYGSNGQCQCQGNGKGKGKC